MKNNKTESEIFEQIRESLERYEETYIPGSWENFLQKRKNNNRKIFLRIASGIAACLLVGFLGINYFQSDIPSEKSVAAVEQAAMSEKSVATTEQSANEKSVGIAEQPKQIDKSVRTAEQSVMNEPSVATPEQSIIKEKSVAAADQSAKSQKSLALTEHSGKIDKSAEQSGMIDKSVTIRHSAKNDQSVAIAEQSANSDKSLATAEQSIKSEHSTATTQQSAKRNNEALVAGSDIRQPADTALKTVSAAGQKKNPTAEVQKNIQDQQLDLGFTPESREKVAAVPSDTKSQSTVNKTNTTKDSPDTTKSKTQNIFLYTPQTADQQPLTAADKRKVRFGVNFSPGVSTTESSSSLNYMGGISADISFTSKVALSTGLQVENQSFVKKMPGIVSSANAPVNQTKTTVTNLDFPVNITWKFAAEKKHAYYVSAGLSSLVYLSQENKNTTYSQDLTPVSSLVNGEEIKSYSILSTMSVTQDAVTPDQAFDLAGRVNLMVGYEKKLSDRIFIHFEPYAKFPTSSQAAGSLNHTTTGINFKISF